MSTNYRIQVRVEMTPCSESVTETLTKTDVRTFEQILSSEQVHSIGECEQLVLETNYAAVRDALSAHLSQVPQQYALEVAGSLESCRMKPYRVDGEVGRISFDNYWVCHPPEEIAPSLFSALHGKEWYRTCGFKEIAFAYGTTEMSYRQASALVNRVRHQSGATPSRTLRENVESEGREVMSFLEQQAQSILEEAGFTPEGIPTEAATGNSCNSVQYDSSQTLLSLPAEQVEQVIRACAPEADWQAEMQRNPVAYEDPTTSQAPSP